MSGSAFQPVLSGAGTLRLNVRFEITNNLRIKTAWKGRVTGYLPLPGTHFTSARPSSFAIRAITNSRSDNRFR